MGVHRAAGIGTFRHCSLPTGYPGVATARPGGGGGAAPGARSVVRSHGLTRMRSVSVTLLATFPGSVGAASSTASAPAR